MLRKYYEEELHYLRELSKEFSKAHPAIAPMLGGPSLDPDVERILEGVAFLTALLRQKIDKESVSLYEEFLEIVFPHYIRPIPSTGFVKFDTKPFRTESVKINRGTYLDSVEIDGTSCRFQTSIDIEVQPLRLINVQYKPLSYSKGEIRVLLELNGITLDKWNPEGVYFLPGGSYSQATRLFMILSENLEKITLNPVKQGKEFTLPRDSLKLIGFDFENTLFDHPIQTFYGYRILQEYFIMPRKFTLMKLEDINRWSNRGKGDEFEIIFTINKPPNVELTINEDSFIFNVAPVVNLFNFDMDPIYFEHKSEKLLLKPSTQKPHHYQVYDVDRIEAKDTRGRTKTIYTPFSPFRIDNHSDINYKIIRERSLIDNTPEVYIAFVYPYDSSPEAEILSIKVLCTNGSLPESLKLGDLCKPTFNTPEGVTFTNITPMSFSIEPPLNRELIWKFIAHLSLNFLSIANLNSLKTILMLYNSPEDRDKSRFNTNLKRIDGIEGLQVHPVRKIRRGKVIHGYEVEMSAKQDHFADLGDLYLFGMVMSRFLSSFVSFGSFIDFTLKELITGASFKWENQPGMRYLV